jgi:hypothetical protein
MITQLPRFVTPAQIRVGDTIRVSAKLGKMTLESVGLVDHMNYWGTYKEWQTVDGQVLFGQLRDQVPLIELMLVPALVQHITLLERQVTKNGQAVALWQE